MVELRKITKENYKECLSLNVAENQKDFVSSTVHSLAQDGYIMILLFPLLFMQTTQWLDLLC